METENYCPHLDSCIEKKQDICYSAGYTQCGFYERKQLTAKIVELDQREKELADRGLIKRVLGNPHDRNLQL